ncbi:MAG: hypothetical protein ACJAXQ_001664 [Parvibaculaceae bacterium]|jgi:hypothetical protein
MRRVSWHIGFSNPNPTVGAGTINVPEALRGNTGTVYGTTKPIII